jgi:two-component system, chemotaxis family, CheB/CheR fusion protein
MQLCDQLAGDIGNHRISEMLKKAGLQVDKINRMIRCYLDSAAIGTKELCHFPVSFDIKELLKEAISDLYLLYPGHILFHKPGPSMQVYADRDMIAQVIQNLLINAIKYSSHADIITVHFRKMENCLQVTVEDHGIGIQPADQEKIFDRFYRVERKKEMPLMGYGIGLYLSKEIIKQHEGNIWLKSEVNKGSKFYFTLPLS